MRRSDTSRACAFSAAETVRLRSDRLGRSLSLCWISGSKWCSPRSDVNC